MASRRVLVVDDEDKIRRVLRGYLEADGFEVIEATTGPAAVEQTRRVQPDVVLLDLRLPELDGLEVLAQIRRTSSAFVIIVSARAEEVDRLLGLAAGADDYVVKPFSPREVVARVKAVLRRGRGEVAPTDAAMAFDGLRIDPASRTVDRRGRSVALSALEFDLLLALARSPGRVFTRRQLIEQVWGLDFYGDERVVDVHVASLRRALGDGADAPEIVGTVRGVGYRFLGTAA